jgi:hypothetical protein
MEQDLSAQQKYRQALLKILAAVAMKKQLLPLHRHDFVKPK